MYVRFRGELGGGGGGGGSDSCTRVWGLLLPFGRVGVVPGGEGRKAGGVRATGTVRVDSGREASPNTLYNYAGRIV